MSIQLPNSDEIFRELTKAYGEHFEQKPKDSQREVNDSELPAKMRGFVCVSNEDLQQKNIDSLFETRVKQVQTLYSSMENTIRYIQRKSHIGEEEKRKIDSYINQLSELNSYYKELIDLRAKQQSELRKRILNDLNHIDEAFTLLIKKINKKTPLFNRKKFSSPPLNHTFHFLHMNYTSFKVQKEILKGKFHNLQREHEITIRGIKQFEKQLNKITEPIPVSTLWGYKVHSPIDWGTSSLSMLDQLRKLQTKARKVKNTPFTRSFINIWYGLFGQKTKPS